MNPTPAHNKPAGDGSNGDMSTRQRVGSLAAVNAESLAHEGAQGQALKSGTASTPSDNPPAATSASNTRPRTTSGVAADVDPYSASHIYYGTTHRKRNVAKARTYSAVSDLRLLPSSVELTGF